MRPICPAPADRAGCAGGEGHTGPVILPMVRGSNRRRRVPPTQTEPPCAATRSKRYSINRPPAMTSAGPEPRPFAMPCIFFWRRCSHRCRPRRGYCASAPAPARKFCTAQCRPGWTFTAVEPSGAMLHVLRDKATRAGIEQRCQFHEGYRRHCLSRPLRRGNLLLVSQFILERDVRIGFFRDIAARLGPERYWPALTGSGRHHASVCGAAGNG